jgi:hypothetical protein
LLIIKWLLIYPEIFLKTYLNFKIIIEWTHIFSSIPTKYKF